MKKLLLLEKLQYQKMSAVFVYSVHFSWVFSVAFPLVCMFMTYWRRKYSYMQFYLVFVVFSKTIFYIINRSSRLKNLIKEVSCSASTDFFSSKVLNFQNYEKNSKVLYAEFPHGIFALSFLKNGTMLTNSKHSIFDLLATLSPFADFLTTFDAIGCSKKVLTKEMKSGQNIHKPIFYVIDSDELKILIAQMVEQKMYIS